jgi:hypothetical protein
MSYIVIFGWKAGSAWLLVAQKDIDVDIYQLPFLPQD